MKDELILHQYINELLRNQNFTNTPVLEDSFSKKDYQNLLKPVMDLLKKQPYMSLLSLRLELYKRSGLKELMENFVKQTQITPGVILDFGTTLTRDTIICGNSQEVIMDKGILIDAKKELTEDTIFDLASTSKLFTCIAILKLDEMGLIDLYAPVTKYVKEFTNLDDVTIYDLLKFKVMIVTDKRIDSAKTKEEAEQILFTAKKKDNQNFNNAYTDIGAMTLKYVVEKVTNMSFNEFVTAIIFKPLNMTDTYLNVPDELLYRVANENYSTIVRSDGSAFTRVDNTPGTQHDPKAIAIGAKQGNAPGHAGYFSTKGDMIKLASALTHGTILKPETVLSISNTETGFKDFDGSTYFYGSLTYIKQVDARKLSVYLPLSGKSFMSPGFAGTTLVVDPINKLNLFIASNRLHNRIYSIPSNLQDKIKVDEHNKKTFVLPNGEEKIVCSSYTKEKEVLVTLAFDLALQYQLLERLRPTDEAMHLVRELN